MNCSNCGMENNSTAKFCAGCGNTLFPQPASSVNVFCSKCGKENSATTKFCGSCGNSLSLNDSSVRQGSQSFSPPRTYSSNKLYALCKCKGFSEDNLVLAIRLSPIEIIGGGCLTWSIHFILSLVTAGGWLIFIGGWYGVKYLSNRDTYKCQYCHKIIEEKNFR